MTMPNTCAFCMSSDPEFGCTNGVFPADGGPRPVDFTCPEFLPALRALVGGSSAEPAARAFASVAAWLQRPLYGEFPQYRPGAKKPTPLTAEPTTSTSTSSQPRTLARPSLHPYQELQ